MATSIVAWPTVALGEVMQQFSRPESVQPEKEYRLLGIRLDGNGPFLRETKLGSQTAATTLSQVRAGDFIYSRLFAWRGAFGTIDSQLDGCYVSGEFPTFRPNADRLDIEFLRYWFRLPATIAAVEADCTGSTPLTRNRYKEQFFLALPIPLPPLDEQQRIVARIEALAARIAEARGLRQAAMAEAEDLYRSILFGGDSTTTPTPMRELVRLRTPDVKVQPFELYQFAGVYSFGRGVFKGQAKYGHEFAYRALTRLHEGDFVYPKLMAWEGALGAVGAECDNLVVSPEFPVFEVNSNRVFPEVLDVYFRTPSVWPGLSGASTGTNVRRRRLQPTEFLNLAFPLPHMETQEMLRKVQARATAMQRLSTTVAVELDALLPSLLDKAFRGEL